MKIQPAASVDNLAPLPPRREGHQLPVRSPRRLLELDNAEFERLWEQEFRQRTEIREEVEQCWPLRTWPFPSEDGWERCRRSLPLVVQVEQGTAPRPPVVLGRHLSVVAVAPFVEHATRRLRRLVDDGLSLVWWDDEPLARELAEEFLDEVKGLVRHLGVCGVTAVITQPAPPESG